MFSGTTTFIVNLLMGSAHEGFPTVLFLAKRRKKEEGDQVETVGWYAAAMLF